MGSSAWSDAHFSDRAKLRSASKAPVFAYTADIHAGKVPAAVNDKLNPKGVIREARDSDVHPESRAIAVLFDVTGSMSKVPAILQANLPKLMGLLIRNGYVSHPAIMVGAIGDAYCDQAPLQVGQFESGIEIEDDLQKLFLESGGGGQQTESYELALYFLANKTRMDCLEKRGQKGYAFIIGDEMAYRKISASQVESIIGDKVAQEDTIEALVAQVKEKYELFVILPNMTSYWNDTRVHKFWQNLVGQNYLKLDDPAGICELIACQIGVCEGAVDAESAASELEDAGTAPALADKVSKALAKVGGGKGADLAVAGSGAASGIESV